MSLATNIRAYLNANTSLTTGGVYLDIAPSDAAGIYVVVEPQLGESINAKGEHFGQIERVIIRTWFDTNKGEDGDTAHAEVVAKSIEFALSNKYSFDGEQQPLYDFDNLLTVGECYLSGFTPKPT